MLLVVKFMVLLRHISFIGLVRQLADNIMR